LFNKPVDVRISKTFEPVFNLRKPKFQCGDYFLLLSGSIVAHPIKLLLNVPAFVVAQRQS
jgi:hypothetical protein